MIKILFMRLIFGVAIMLAVFGANAQSVADKYPAKPIRLIVPFGPGGVADVTARVMASGLDKKLGQTLVVENYPGAGGITGALNLVHSAPDGYTLFIVSNQSAVSPSLFKSLPYDPVQQFAMISMVGSFDIVMAVDKDSSIKTVKDAIDAAKRDPAHFNFGTIGVGSTQHLSSEMFRSMAGLSVPNIPFKSSGEVLAAVRGKSV
jgi:tripartite-type tricarboxylate transporter receptor subunit TctC